MHFKPKCKGEEDQEKKPIRNLTKQLEQTKGNEGDMSDRDEEEVGI